MKTELTTEQSNHLIELGVPEEFASLCEQAFDDGYRKNPIFKLDDFLNEKILPKEIKVNNSTFNLEIHFYNDIVHVIYCVGGMFPLAVKKSKELIDALYKLTVWTIKNGHLKF